MAKAKKKPAKKTAKKSVSAPKRDSWTIKRIWLPLGLAVLALLVSSQVTYTQNFRSDVLGDEDERLEQNETEDRNESEDKNETEDADNSNEDAKRLEEQRRREEKVRREIFRIGAKGTPRPTPRLRETEIRRADGTRVKTKTEDDGSTKVEIESKQIKFKFEEHNGKLELRARTADGAEVETAEHRKALTDLERELDEEEVEISSEDGKLEIEHNAVRARTHFPLSVDPSSNAFIVTTPQGERTIGVLPDKALENMLRDGVLNRVKNAGFPVATDSASPPDVLEMKVQNGNLVYEVEGEKEHRLFGLVPLTTKKKVTVSALSGELLSETQSFMSTLIDTLSF